MNGSHRFQFDDRHKPPTSEGNPLMPTTVRPISGFSAPSVSRTNGRDVRGTQDTDLGSLTTADISLRQAALVAGLIPRPAGSCVIVRPAPGAPAGGSPT